MAVTARKNARLAAKRLFLTLPRTVTLRSRRVRSIISVSVLAFTLISILFYRGYFADLIIYMVDELVYVVDPLVYLADDRVSQ